MQLRKFLTENLVKQNSIYEELIGEEMSFTIHDGTTFKNFGTAQDHKRALEGDMKNTEEWKYSPSRLINKELENKILIK